MGDLPPRGISIRRERLNTTDAKRATWRSYARIGWLLICAFIVYKSLGELAFYRPGIWAPTLIVPIDVVENVLVYVAFGALAIVGGIDRLSVPPPSGLGPSVPRHWVRRSGKIALIAVLFSAANEALQLYTIDRVASLTDIVSAAAGAFAGAAAVAAWRSPQ